MTEAQIKFLELSKRYEALTEEMKQVKLEMQETMAEIKVGTFLQDPETMLVYQIVVPKGKYMYFDTIDYIRTKKSDEKMGELSMKKAEEAGFVLSK
jgi:hypothetical protein